MGWGKQHDHLYRKIPPQVCHKASRRQADRQAGKQIDRARARARAGERERETEKERPEPSKMAKL